MHPNTPNVRMVDNFGGYTAAAGHAFMISDALPARLQGKALVTEPTAKLIGTNRSSIVSEVSRLLDDQHAYEAMANAVNPYGDGQVDAADLAILLGSWGLCS